MQSVRQAVQLIFVWLARCLIRWSSGLMLLETVSEFLFVFVFEWFLYSKMRPN